MLMLFKKRCLKWVAHSLLLVITITSASSCCLSSTKTEPHIFYEFSKNDICRKSSAFPPLTSIELKSDWGRELLIGEHFAKGIDLYRAITALKRAQILIPNDLSERRHQVDFMVIECYYYGMKYCEALEAFKESSLSSVSPEFPAFRDLLIILHDCYDKMQEFDKAELILKLIEKGDSALANDIQLSIALIEGDIPSSRVMASLSEKCQPVNAFIDQYRQCSKSPRKAQMLNAVLPGAGYYYVGQKRAAVTSFVINTLFIATAYQFFSRNYIAAGLITTSLESGWYLGGINGAGLAAKEYNEQLYNNLGKGMMTRNDLFPVLMLETNF